MAMGNGDNQAHQRRQGPQADALDAVESSVHGPAVGEPDRPHPEQPAEQQECRRDEQGSGRTATANAAAVGPLAKTTAAIAAVVPAARVT
ncbi:MAG: hypothetical protein IPM08_01060 [Actinomycetales bacterium]|nr:hypothetical protein [Actinomycetales bacterium]